MTFKTCPHCGYDGCEPLGHAAFAATWECSECHHLWDFGPGDEDREDEFLTDCWVDLIATIVQTENRTTPSFASLSATEREWMHYLFFPLRLSHSRAKIKQIRKQERKLEKSYWDSNTHWHVIIRPDGLSQRSRLEVEAEGVIDHLAEQGWEFVEQKPIGGRVRYWFRRAERVESLST